MPLDPSENSIAPVGEYELSIQRAILEIAPSIKVEDFVFSRLNIEVNPEHCVYVTDRNSWLRLAFITTKATAKTKYIVEWPHQFPGEDGHFVELEHKKMQDAIRHFEFCRNMLLDVGRSMHEVVGRG